MRMFSKSNHYLTANLDSQTRQERLVDGTPLPLLTSPLCTVGWLAKKEINVLANQPIYPSGKTAVNCEAMMRVQHSFFYESLRLLLPTGLGGAIIQLRKMMTG